MTISIKDVNDSPPRFEQDEYILKIPETYALQDPILYLNVLDDDLPDTNYNFFSIEEGFGWGGSLFHVNAYNKTTAELRVKSQLDYENKDHRRGFSIKIKVNDKGQGSNDQSHIAFCVVNITITDINDNPPVFTEPQKSSSVSEDAPVGTSLEKFHATDADNDGLSKVR